MKRMTAEKKFDLHSTETAANLSDPAGYGPACVELRT